MCTGEKLFGASGRPQRPSNREAGDLARGCSDLPATMGRSTLGRAGGTPLDDHDMLTLDRRSSDRRRVVGRLDGSCRLDASGPVT